MWLELSNLWIVLLNAVCIPVIHLGVSWFFTRLDPRSFDPGSFLFRERPWEKGGSIYQTVFRVRRWKAHLPDAAPWLDGFAKERLEGKSPVYLRRFIVETCRGEAAHHAQAVALLATLAWNPWPYAALVMIGYAVLSNLPCVILQRFTRARMWRVLRGAEEGKRSGA